jgi:hypothetical protein
MTFSPRFLESSRWASVVLPVVTFEHENLSVRTLNLKATLRVNAVYLAPMIVRSSLPQNLVVRHEISDSDIARFFSFAQNVSSTRSSLKSLGRRFQPIVPLNKMLAIVSDQ